MYLLCTELYFLCFDMYILTQWNTFASKGFHMQCMFIHVANYIHVQQVQGVLSTMLAVASMSSITVVYQPFYPQNCNSEGLNFLRGGHAPRPS